MMVSRLNNKLLLLKQLIELKSNYNGSNSSIHKNLDDCINYVTMELKSELITDKKE